MKTSNQTYSRFHKVLLISSLACMMFGTVAVQADDVEIYLTPPPDPVPPNLLFVLDESSSMRSTHSTSDNSICGRSSCSRTEELQAALQRIFADPASGGIENVTAAMLGYSKRDHLGRRVISDFISVDDNRSTFQNLITKITNPGGTTTVQAMAAAVEWYQSGFTDDDGTNGQDGWSGDVGNGLGGLDGDAYDTVVTTPVNADDYCIPNTIILLTDGQPYSHQSSSNADRDDDHPYRNTAPIPFTYRNGEADQVVCTNPDPSGFSMDRAGCTGDIAEWAYNNDLFPSITGTQNVVTHTVGFHTGTSARTYLTDIATRGGGLYFESNDTDDLVDAFDTIIGESKNAIPYTYNAPTIPYNPDNAAISSDFLYVPVFRPLNKRYWKGNLKKYRVGVDSNTDLFIKDQNGDDVVNADFSFKTDTQDYWSGADDTGETYLGGAVYNMSGSTPRNLYTWLDDNPLTPLVDPTTGAAIAPDPTSTDLTATVTTVDPNGDAVTISPNRVHNDNIVITQELVAAGSANFRRTLLRWVNWIGDKRPSSETYSRNDDFPLLDDTAGTNPDGIREFMGGPLHSTPEVARYRPVLSFVPASTVNPATDTITFTSNHPWSTGDIVVYSNEGGTSLGIEGDSELGDGGEYFVVSTGGGSIQLATTKDNADADPAVVIDLADASDRTGNHRFETRVAIDVVLMTTTEGVLHAFDAGTDTKTTPVGDGGDELWSFMPRHLLSKITRLRNNPAAETPDYGLDGPLTVYESEDTSTGEIKKYVVMTMRRGGRNIYALDITDRGAPKMAWEILGGTTGNGTPAQDFERLGQTWSKPQLVKMELNGAAAKDVLVFGGGYHPRQDDQTTRTNDGYSNAIYIVDAQTGARLAYFTHNTTTDTTNNILKVTNMKNGVIGLLTVDINNNGIVDRLYASGVGGRIFRIDIPDTNFTSTTIKGGVIADVNDGSADDEGFQRFFSAPEVAYYSRGGITYLTILIGSGFLPSPLDNTTTDRFYAIKDTDVFAVPSSYTVIGEGDLYDATDNVIQEEENELDTLQDELAACEEQHGVGANPCRNEADDVEDQIASIAQEKAALAAEDGWFIDLLDGTVKQKNFSSPIVFNSVVLFSTYQGSRSASTNVCSASSTSGLSNVYAVNLVDGSAVIDLYNADTGFEVGDVVSVDENGENVYESGDGVVDRSDRSVGLNIPGLPPTPVIVFPDPGTGDVSLSGRQAVAIVGLEAAFKFPDRFFPVNWEEVIDTTPLQTQ